jgi:hypothetical protein
MVRLATEPRSSARQIGGVALLGLLVIPLPTSILRRTPTTCVPAGALSPSPQHTKHANRTKTISNAFRSVDVPRGRPRDAVRDLAVRSQQPRQEEQREPREDRGERDPRQTASNEQYGCNCQPREPEQERLPVERRSLPTGHN